MFRDSNPPTEEERPNLSGYTVRRSWINPDMTKDLFDIYGPGGELVANVAYQVAHDFIMGRIMPAELAGGDNGTNSRHTQPHKPKRPHRAGG
jgi:hypothetical protein